jgi:hypothetical protein
VSHEDDVTPEPTRCDCNLVLCTICHPPKRYADQAPQWTLTDKDREFLRVNKISTE